MTDTTTAQTPPSPQPGPLTPGAKSGNGLATAGFVLGLLGLLGSFIPVLNVVGIVLGVIGAVLAGVGLAKARRSGTGKGLAVSGIVLGVLALVVGIVVNVAFATAVDDALDVATKPTVEVPAEPSGDTTDPADDDASDDAAAGSVVGTTRDNPAPIGSAITDSDWTVTVNSVTTAAKDKYGQTPAAGMTLLLINVTATYNGNDPQGDSVWATVDFITADGTTIDSTDGFFIPEDQFDSLATLYGGASVSGNKMIQVPADSWQNGVLAVSPSMFADNTFVAVQ